MVELPAAELACELLLTVVSDGVRAQVAPRFECLTAHAANEWSVHPLRQQLYIETNTIYG